MPSEELRPRLQCAENTFDMPLAGTGTSQGETSKPCHWLAQVPGKAQPQAWEQARQPDIKVMAVNSSSTSPGVAAALLLLLLAALALFAASQRECTTMVNNERDCARVLE